MKKKNIVRITAFILAVLMCLTCTATLFAENVDATEVSSEAETKEKETESDVATQESKETEAVSETETQTVSSGDSQNKRSELGQKILDFKNPDDLKDKKLFGEWGFTFDNTVENPEITGLDGRNEIQLACTDGDCYFRVYNKVDDKFYYITSTVKKSNDGFDYNNYSLTNDSSKEVIILANDIPTISLGTINSVSDLYLIMYDKDKNLNYVIPYSDSYKYAGIIYSIRADLFCNATPVDDSTYKITVEPVVEEDNSVQAVRLTFSYKLNLDYTSSKFDGYFNEGGVFSDYSDRLDKADRLRILTNDDSLVKTIDLGLKDEDTITTSIYLDSNGTYKFKLSTLFGYIYTETFNVDCLRDGKSTALTEDNLAKAAVSFSGIPDSAYTNDSITLKMNTDKKCVMTFNGKSVANDAYVTSGDITVTSNGTYYYTAITESGVATEGTLEINFFKERENTQASDPLDTDLVSAKTDESLSQTGVYQIWLIILAVVFCGFGITLILNQKYHFLNNIVRRLKHESN